MPQTAHARQWESSRCSSSCCRHPSAHRQLLRSPLLKCSIFWTLALLLQRYDDTQAEAATCCMQREAGRVIRVLPAWEAAHAAACPSVRNGRRVHLLGDDLTPNGLASSLHLSSVTGYQEGCKKFHMRDELLVYACRKGSIVSGRQGRGETAGMLTIDGDSRVASLHVGHGGSLHHRIGISLHSQALGIPRSSGAQKSVHA